MEMRFNREITPKTLTMQKKLATNNRKKIEKVPDLTDFMNDMFFGTINHENKVYNLKGEDGRDDDDDDGFDDSTRRSKLTQDWLDEARRMVASSPSRCDSPPSSRIAGPPRFAAVPGRLSVSSQLERRDPLSRSARRNRAVESFSGEILTKSAKHSRNRSFTLDPDSPTSPSSQSDISPASTVHKWFSTILNIPTSETDLPTAAAAAINPDQNPPIVPSRQSVRKSRFQNDPNAPQSQPIPVAAAAAPVPVPYRRTFKTNTPTLLQNTQLLSPPKNLIESADRRSISSSTCVLLEKPVLSPPRNLVESAHRRSISSSTCSMYKVVPKGNGNGVFKETEGGKNVSLNGFLKEQRIRMEKILNGEVSSKAKIVLSGPSNSTSSMVAAICYAWLLENKPSKNNGEGDGEDYVIVPVINVKRGRMWKQRQAAWLFHHLDVDATSLLFADEVDLESLIMAGKLAILVIGQDVVKTNGEVGSKCTILTDNYCEDAYDLLQTPMLKKLLLAGILLDTQNLNSSSTLSTTRDAEAVQLLLVGTAPNYRNALFDQLMQDQRENSFLEALLHNYGKPPNESALAGGAQMEHRVTERKSTSISRHEANLQKSAKNNNDARGAKAKKDFPKSAKPSTVQPQVPAAKTAQDGKNKNFFSKWFGFGSK